MAVLSKQVASEAGTRVESLPRFAQFWPTLTDQQPGYSRSQVEDLCGLPVCIATQVPKPAIWEKGKRL
ncbi:hypothetical protein SYN63AY4M2_03480 [Synechococcus sp. 63AY4M2]|nr:hypothetical protein CYA_0828 [Synechococcus sp. JA-3-3Ab]PIK87382.1 hypothetical protein SYN63AY4M2_03480 [Synechococcus sp. 63AY4M2]PIK93076.1 hypothetical protein SYN65AY6LI_00625 [Synechococcus sp. 65AY6Li]